MSVRSVLPTHTCFDDAMDLFFTRLGAHPEDTPVLRLVHGVCRDPDGQLYAHAWVEWQQWCLFVGLLDGHRTMLATTRAEYYAELRVQQRTRYALPTVLRENHRSGHVGPWIPRYRALCRTPEPRD